jgi:hypothetical protein
LKKSLAKKPEVGIGIFEKSPHHSFLRNQQLKSPRSFVNEPILIRVKEVSRILR